MTTARAKAATFAWPVSSNGISNTKPNSKTIAMQMAEASPALLDLYHLTADYILALGDDVEAKTTAIYIAFRRTKNFASLEFRNQAKKLLVFVKVDPATVAIEPGFTRDVRGIGHFGTGDLEITLQTPAELDKAKALFEAAHDRA